MCDGEELVMRMSNIHTQRERESERAREREIGPDGCSSFGKVAQ